MSTTTQPDQKIIVAGHFSNVNGVPRKNIARVGVTGEGDGCFDPGAGTDDTVIDVALQRDGKLVIGGRFFNIGSQPRQFLARLEADGSLDPTLDLKESFTDPFGGLPTIQSIQLLRNGRMLIGGLFDSYQGCVQFGLVRLRPDGRRDGSFAIGGGFPDTFDPSIPAFGGSRIFSFNGVVRLNGDPGKQKKK